MNRDSRISETRRSALSRLLDEKFQIPIDLAHIESFEIGPLLVEPSRRSVHHKDGRLEILEPLALLVLVALAAAGGELLSRSDLINSCWGGRVVGDNAITRVISQLRKLQNDIANESFSIETITKIGYRLVSQERDTSVGKDTKVDRAVTRPRLLLLCALFAISVAFASWFAFSEPASSDPVRVAVLPFRSTAGAEDIALSVADELSRNLSRHSGLEIIGRVSSRSVATHNLSAKEIGEKLTVAFIVEGTVTQDTDRVSVDIGIVEPNGQTTIWTNSFAGSNGDLAKFNAEIRADVIAALLPGRRAGRSGSEPVFNGDAYNSFLTARRLVRGMRPDGTVTARQLLMNVTKAEPEFARAWAELAQVETVLLLGPSGIDLGPTIAKDYSLAKEYAERAVALAPELADGHAASALISVALYDQHNRQSDRQAAIRSAKLAIKREQSNAQTWMIYAAALVREGRNEEVLPALLKAHELDPFWHRTRAAPEAAWGLGRKELAIDLMQRLARDHPNPSERKVAEASLALWDRSISSYILLTREAANLTASGHNLLYMMYGDKGLARLGYVIPKRVNIAPYGRLNLIHNQEHSNLKLIDWPWTSPISVWDPSVGHQVAYQLVKQGRSDEIVEVWDEFYQGSIAEFRRSHGFSRWAFHGLAPWLATGLRQAGRDQEANEILSAAHIDMSRWRSKGPVQSDTIVEHARILAMMGERASAISALRSAVAQGWPYLIPTQRYIEIAIIPLHEDPTFSALRKNPEFNTLADQIDAITQRERLRFEGTSKETFRDIP